MAGFGVDSALFQESIPLQDPSLESRIKGVPVAGCQCCHQRLQFTACRKTRVPREFSSDNGAHVVLAHLHLVILEKREKCLHPIDDDAVNHIAVTLNPGERFGIVRGALMGDMLQV